MKMERWTPQTISKINDFAEMNENEMNTLNLRAAPVPLKPLHIKLITRKDANGEYEGISESVINILVLKLKPPTDTFFLNTHAFQVFNTSLSKKMSFSDDRGLTDYIKNQDCRPIKGYIACEANWSFFAGPLRDSSIRHLFGIVVIPKHFYVYYQGESEKTADDHCILLHVDKDLKLVSFYDGNGEEELYEPLAKILKRRKTIHDFEGWADVLPK